MNLAPSMGLDSIKHILKVGQLIYNEEHDVMSFKLPEDLHMVLLSNNKIMHISGNVLDYVFQQQWLTLYQTSASEEHHRAWVLYTKVADLGRALLLDDERFIACCYDTLNSGVIDDYSCLILLIETVLRHHKNHGMLCGKHVSRATLIHAAMTDMTSFIVFSVQLKSEVPNL